MWLGELTVPLKVHLREDSSKCKYLKMTSAKVVRCIYFLTLLTYVSTGAISVDPDQIAPAGAV